ncbi:hypothetical protein Tco_0157772 [Tanacetum coccineum]
MLRAERELPKLDFIDGTLNAEEEERYENGKNDVKDLKKPCPENHYFASLKWCEIMDWLLPISKQSNVLSIVGCLLVATVSYFIWQERNNRVHSKGERKHGELAKIIMDVTRLTLASIKFKKKARVKKRALNGRLRTWLFRRTTMEFNVVRSPPPYNIILGRSIIKDLRVVAFTIYSMMKFHHAKSDKKKGTDERGLKMEGSTEEVVVNLAFPDQKVVIGEKLSPEGKIWLKSLLKRSLDGLAWQQCDMVGILRDNLPSSVASMDLKPCSSQERSWDVKNDDSRIGVNSHRQFIPLKNHRLGENALSLANLDASIKIVATQCLVIVLFGYLTCLSIDPRVLVVLRLV